MAIQKRYNGDAAGVANVDISINGAVSAPGVVISTGIGKHPTFVKVTAGASLDAEMGVGGAVETLIRAIAVQATVLAYQVNGAVLSVLLEASGWVNDATLSAALAALGNRAADPAVPVTAFDFTGTAASTAGGFALA